MLRIRRFTGSGPVGNVHRMPVPTAPGAPPDRTVQYGTHPDQLYDVRLPRATSEAEPRDVTVVVIHGGFWRPEIDRTHAAAQSTAFAAKGFHVATIEYRRIPGDWPTMAADVLTAITALQADAEIPDRVVLLGHSAGGHLATWATYQPEVSVTGTVSLAGCVDLHLTRDLDLDGGATLALMGSAPESVWRAADPALLGRPPVPVRLVHGDADDRVPVEVSESYQAAADAGIPLQVLAGCGHYELIDTDAAQFPHTIAAVDAVLQD